jgi:D-methionine transport system substrate-binding protein
MKKKLICLLLVASLLVGLAACSPSGGTTDQTTTGEQAPVTLKVGASPSPHAQILNLVKDDLAAQGITLEVVEFEDYILPNTSVEDGSLDANYFQHLPYLNSFNEEKGTHLVPVEAIHF